jgi:hypothetical protein
MKTRFLPLLTLCGVVASSGIFARAIEANPGQSRDATSAVPASAAPQFSGRINDVVALSKSGVDQSIVLAFIKTSPGPFAPSADEIIKLRDMGISTPILTAMLERGAQVREEAKAAVAAAPQQPSVNPSQAPVISETPPSTYAGADYSVQPASTVTYIGGGYSYPYYSYPYYYPVYYSGWYSTAFFYPYPCWYNGIYYAHGCYFPRGGYIHDGFHVHDGHGGFHGDGHGDFRGSGAGLHTGVSGSGGFHASPVNSGRFQSSGFSVNGTHSMSTGGGIGRMPVGGGIGRMPVGGGIGTMPVGGGIHSMPSGGGSFHGGVSGGGGGFRGGGGIRH